MLEKGTAAVSAEIGRQFGSDLYAAIKSIKNYAVTYTQVSLEIGFQKYIETNFERCRWVKTVINRFERVDILKIYEYATLSMNKAKVAEDDLFQNIEENRIIITGTAGSGKSFLMKRAFLRLVRDKQWIPANIY